MSSQAQHQYYWEGKDKNGVKHTGQVQGTNLDMVRAQLRRRGLSNLKVKKEVKSLFGGKKSKITSADVTVFSRQLTAMMQSGVPLVQALEIAAQGQDSSAMRQLVNNIKMDVEAGSTFSNALSQHPTVFDELFCSLVEAGEQSGTLDTLLNELATHKEKAEALKAKVKKAMIYPIAVLVVAFVVSCILLMFVVPQFEALFASVGGDLPYFTRLVVNLSEWMQSNWYILFGAIGGGIFVFIKLHARSPTLAKNVDRLLLKMPVIGDLLTKSAIARFARTLSTMSRAGVPLVEALDSASGTTGNIIFTEAVVAMRELTATGERLNVAMRQSNLFPNMVCQMVSIGEEAGSLDSMLGKVADYYDEQVDNAVEGLTSLMEPMIMAFLGVVIGGLIVAMYLPIFKMGDAF